MEDEFFEPIEGMFFDVKPAKEGFFPKPGELPFGVLAGGFFKLGGEVGEIVVGLRGLKKLEGLPIADGLRSRRVCSESFLFEFPDFGEEPFPKHFIAPPFDAGVESFARVVEKPAPKIVFLFLELFGF